MVVGKNKSRPRWCNSEDGNREKHTNYSIHQGGRRVKPPKGTEA